MTTTSHQKGRAASLGPFHGVWTAIVTPFRDDQQIDWDAYEELLKKQEKAGVKGVVVSGTTGESPTLAVQEKLALIRKARATLGANVRVMAGTGDNNTLQSIELSKLAQDAGADSLLIVTPPYNKPSTAGLVNHYTLIAQAVKIPLCLYHVPGRTAQLLSPEQLAAITAVKGVACVKEASADLALYSRALMKSRSIFLSGDDPTYLGSLAVGGAGVISVVSNIFPEAMVALTDAFFANDREKALKLHEALLPAIDILFCEVNPCPTKAAMAALGWAKNVVRAPLAPVGESNFRRIDETIKAAAENLKGLLRG